MDEQEEEDWRTNCTLKGELSLIKKFFLIDARDVELVISELRDYESLAKSRKEQQRKHNRPYHGFRRHFDG